MRKKSKYIVFKRMVVCINNLEEIHASIYKVIAVFRDPEQIRNIIQIVRKTLNIRVKVM